MQYPTTPSSHHGHTVPRTPPSQTGRHHHNGQLPTPGAPYMFAAVLPQSALAPGHTGLPPTPYMPTVPLPIQHNSTGLLTPPESPVSRSRSLTALNDHLFRPNYTYDMRYDVDHAGLRSALQEHATIPATGQLAVLVQLDQRMLTINIGDGRAALTVRDVLHRLHRELTKILPNGGTLLQLIGRRYIFDGLEPSGGNTFTLKLRR
ncbi:uncharacterized protein PHACADRAFT_214846 [Phanerochaete carnosa HHB-10118-sp]|uniref:Uncharacterized protein n=1 Tax=Phanerochaete carnosa (strain HHB-10118-sp) TaxID=650164 RepID=K5VP57_PHACS|nr:uncharacterized protein PHACADRAFT_214846 [Phanerochaete carnosa HHB-10118-sp]EKM48334.1 hypothetical protein PHACADRAFT_214846 [Phanerochaete carnosa HHB-10118-sp]